MFKMNLRQTNANVWVGSLLIIFFILVGLLAPVIAPSDPTQVHIDIKLSPPTWAYPLGTDHLGRCELSRLLYGTRTSLFYSLLALGIVLAISIPLGLISGYAGGIVDHFLMRVVDIVLAFPSLILSLAITAMLGPSLPHLLLAFIAVWWAAYTRMIRGIVLQIKERDYITAAKAAGTMHAALMLRHILRNALRPIIILASMEIGTIILSISALSFLGLGAQPPTAEWGAMLNDSRPYMQLFPRLMLFPGLIIMVVVIGFMMLGEGLRGEKM